MVSRGQISLKAIRKMLKKCAPGFEMVAKTHNYRVTYKDRVYPALPLGPHGKRTHVSIEIGHIRSMIRALGIQDCAQRVLPQLR